MIEAVIVIAFLAWLVLDLLFLYYLASKEVIPEELNVLEIVLIIIFELPLIFIGMVFIDLIASCVRADQNGELINTR